MLLYLCFYQKNTKINPPNCIEPKSELKLQEKKNFLRRLPRGPAKGRRGEDRLMR
jgi:hypothetical protein